MQIELTPEQNSFIDLGIQQGRFQNSEEAVQQALALWEKRERARIELFASLGEAQRSLDAGEGEEYTIETLPKLAESVKAWGRARLAGK
ncbi:ribbon-helix-helix domain-containing protein [Terracidiphilus sp.]|jgi:putative addiction module CopG family antidote|uniref:ribbon-helix-helix domain-containing protein n=1 Tax=Terracidiphilus sp. TaxID=1964191 RepID=UPI003C199581